MVLQKMILLSLLVESQMAAYRVAAVLSYIGVEDVRVLNGGLAAWTGAGYEVETTSNKPEPVK